MCVSINPGRCFSRCVVEWSRRGSQRGDRRRRSEARRCCQLRKDRQAEGVSALHHIHTTTHKETIGHTAAPTIGLQRCARTDSNRSMRRQLAPSTAVRPHDPQRPLPPLLRVSLLPLPLSLLSPLLCGCFRRSPPPSVSPLLPISCAIGTRSIAACVVTCAPKRRADSAVESPR